MYKDLVCNGAAKSHMQGRRSETIQQDIDGKPHAFVSVVGCSIGNWVVSFHLEFPDLDLLVNSI